MNSVRRGVSMKNYWLSILRSGRSPITDFSTKVSCQVGDQLRGAPPPRESGLEMALGKSLLLSENHGLNGMLRSPIPYSWNSILPTDKWTRKHVLIFRSSFQLATRTGQNMRHLFFARSLASESTDPKKKRGTESRKEISTVEDPFDAPTYNIPEKPVTFTEGASYSIVILAGLGIAAAAAYGVFKELIFEPKEYKIFNKALDRVQNDSQVRVRIGSPITGYGSESRNRAARQRIPNKTWTDEDGVEHIMVNFHVRGPHGAGKVYTEMFKDKVDKQWKFMYLIVEVASPSPAQLMLESYVPA